MCAYSPTKSDCSVRVVVVDGLDSREDSDRLAVRLVVGASLIEGELVMQSW